jgi:hypothetical protein
MAPSRRRSNTNFESKQTEETLEEKVTIEEIVAKEPEASLPPLDLVIESITPTECPEPRVEEKEKVAPAAKTARPTLKAPPKRHPRNVPRFSAYK